MRIKLGRHWWLLMGGFVLLGASVACSLGGAGSPPLDEIATEVAHAVELTLTAKAHGITSEPPTLQTSTQTAAPATDTLAASVTPAPTETATARPIPTAAAPTSETFPDSSYVLAEEHILGEYAVRIWTNENSPSDTLGFDQIATISRSEAEPIAIEFFMDLHELTGTDINGDGFIDVIIDTYTGGAHCCFATLVFSLGDEATKIMETRPSNCGGQFSDFDGDGRLEFTTCDDIFAYIYCPYAASPLVSAVLAFEEGAGYVAANTRFAEIYQTDLDRLRTMAETGAAGELGEWDGTNKCSVLPYILALLYSGDTDTAWSELERVYPSDDRAAFQGEIEQMAQGSTLYVAP